MRIVESLRDSRVVETLKRKALIRDAHNIVLKHPKIEQEALTLGIVSQNQLDELASDPGQEEMLQRVFGAYREGGKERVAEILDSISPTKKLDLMSRIASFLHEDTDKK